MNNENTGCSLNGESLPCFAAFLAARAHVLIISFQGFDSNEVAQAIFESDSPAHLFPSLEVKAQCDEVFICIRLMATAHAQYLATAFASDYLEHTCLILVLIQELARGFGQLETRVNQVFHEYDEELMGVFLSADVVPTPNAL
jgi:hypothetical protein